MAAQQRAPGDRPLSLHGKPGGLSASSNLHPDDPLRDALGDRFVTVQHAELGDDVGKMKGHAPFRDPELEADFGAGHPVRGQLQALAFPRAQRLALGLRRDAFLDDAPDEQLVEALAEDHHVAQVRRDLDAPRGVDDRRCRAQRDQRARRNAGIDRKRDAACDAVGRGVRQEGVGLRVPAALARLVPDEREGALFEWNRFYKEIAIGTGLGIRLDFNFFLIRGDFGLKLRDPALPEGKRFIPTNRGIKTNDLKFQFGIGYPF